MKRIMVTGGFGFIGWNFIRFARAIHPEWKFTNVDKATYAGTNRAKMKGLCERTLLRDINSLTHHDLNGIDVIVNFAAETHVDVSIANSELFARSNVQGAVRLMELARGAKTPLFIQVSTDEVYGHLGPYDPPFTETNPIKPRNPYAASKAAADLFAKTFVMTHEQPIIIVRSSNNYGPGQHPEKLIPKLIQNAIRGEHLPIYGDGSNIRDWIHVNDFANGIMRIIEQYEPKMRGEVFNFGGGNIRTNLELAKTICRLADQPESLVKLVDDRPGHDQRYEMNWSKVNRWVRWEPVASFNAELAKLVEAEQERVK